MNFIDRMFLLWHSIPSMAAALPAGMTHFALLCFPLGVASYVNTFVAQYHGAERPERIGHAIWQAVRFAGCTIPLMMLTIPLAPLIFSLSGHDADVFWLEVIYFQVLAFGGGAMVMAAALASFFTGRGKTRVVMYVNTGAAVINMVLDYAWIFGNFGFPELGIEGAAWATVVSQWAKVVCYLAIMLIPKSRETFGLVSGRRFDWPLMVRLLRFGGASGLQMFVEIGAFTLFILLMGQLGRDAIASTTLAFNVNSIAFVPMLGLGLAVSTMVGQQLGRDQPDLAARATWTGLQIGLVYSSIMGLLYVSFPDMFLMGHASGMASGEFGRLRDTTVILLRFVAAYCLFDTIAIMFTSAIKGAGDTRFILIVSLVVSPIPVLLAWGGIALFGWGLLWCWVILTGWIWLTAVLYCVRFLRGKWRDMRVIEPSVLVGDLSPAVQSTIVEADSSDFVAEAELPP